MLIVKARNEQSIAMLQVAKASNTHNRAPSRAASQEPIHLPVIISFNPYTTHPVQQALGTWPPYNNIPGGPSTVGGAPLGSTIGPLLGPAPHAAVCSPAVGMGACPVPARGCGIFTGNSRSVCIQRSRRRVWIFSRRAGNM